VIERDALGIDTRYFEAVSNLAYETAFGKLLMRPNDARASSPTPEALAVRAVAQTVQASKMSIGDPTAGGYGLPLVLDPSIMLTMVP
jgi:hypothetical protein